MDYPPGIVLDGARSMLLRKAFWEVGEKTISPEIEHILVAFGADPQGLAEPVIRYLSDRFPDRRLTVVRGGLTPEEVRARMESCDMALSAAGQTMIELARCGVPSLIFQTADNQRANIRMGQQAGFFDRLSTLDTLAADLDRMGSPEERLRRSKAGRQLVDGKGARRTVRRILHDHIASRLTCRIACPEDLMPLFELANDPLVRRNSFTTAEIPLDDHRRWFENNYRKIRVFEVDGALVGQVRFDVRPTETVTGLSLSPAFRGLGLGAELLRRAIAEIEQARTITAYIKPENTASQKSFEQAGYRYDPQNNRWVFRVK
jgi:ribosomal protein S18 acetylase RimI-like enzyme